MKAELRTARVLIGWVPVLLLALAACLIVLIPTGPDISAALLPVTVAAGIGLLAMRISRIVEAGVWRLLPGGRRIIARATAIVVLTLSLTLGMAWLWVSPNASRHVPLWPVLALFIHFSLLGLLLLIGIGQRIPRFLVIVYLALCVLSFGYSMQHFGRIAWFWFATATACAAIWLLASFGKLPFRDVANAHRWLPAVRAVYASALALVNWRVASVGSPVRTLLRTRQSAAFLSLPVAALVLLIWAKFQHVFIGGGPFDSFRAVLGSESWMLCAVMLVLAQRYAAAAGSLWLLWGNSRGQIFRLVERNTFLDALVLGAFAWLAATLLGVLRGLPLEPNAAVKMFIACVGVGFMPAYLGLIWSTCHAWWQKALALVPIVFALSYHSSQWLVAMGLSNTGMLPVSSNRLALLVCYLAALRAMAAWRWSTLDWAQIRSSGGKK